MWVSPLFVCRVPGHRIASTSGQFLLGEDLLCRSVATHQGGRIGGCPPRWCRKRSAAATAHRGRLLSHTQVHTPALKLPELTAERFIDLNPLLPYQIDLIINVVSGLRTQGGAPPRPASRAHRMRVLVRWTRLGGKC